MKLVCESGDLALVVKDEAVAVENIGKVVKVQGPLKVNKRLQLRCWLIEPVNPSPWVCLSRFGQVSKKVVTFASYIEHTDAWLLPIRSDKKIEDKDQDTIDPIDSDAALVRSCVLTPDATNAFWDERAKGMGYTTPTQLEALRRGDLPTRWEYENKKTSNSRWKDKDGMLAALYTIQTALEASARATSGRQRRQVG